MRMGISVPAQHKHIFPENHDYSFGVLIWKATNIYKDVKFCKDAKRSIFVELSIKAKPPLQKRYRCSFDLKNLKA